MRTSLWRRLGVVLAVVVLLSVALVPAASASGAAAPAAAGCVYYVVRPGDNLTRIAARFGTTVWSLQQQNGIKNPDRIYIGQRLRICSPVPPPPIGDIDEVELHNEYELFAAVVVNLIATVLKFGDRTQIGAVHLATSLVADLQLIAAAVVVGLGVQRVTQRARQSGDVGRRVPVRRCPVRQRGLGGAPGRRDRVLPPPLAPRRSAVGARAASPGPPAGRSRRRSSAAVFLVLRRMRTPLIVLIAIFAISVLGLTLVPGSTRRRARGGWASSTPSTS